jgi:hypothetical protein
MMEPVCEDIIITAVPSCVQISHGIDRLLAFHHED